MRLVFRNVGADPAREANLPNVEALALQSGGRYRFLPGSDASPAELARYVKSHQLGFPLYTISPVFDALLTVVEGRLVVAPSRTRANAGDFLHSRSTA